MAQSDSTVVDETSSNNLFVLDEESEFRSPSQASFTSSKESSFVNDTELNLKQKNLTQSDSHKEKKKSNKNNDPTTFDSKSIVSSSNLCSDLRDCVNTKKAKKHVVNAARKKKLLKRNKKNLAIKVVRVATVQLKYSDKHKVLFCRLCNKMFYTGEEIR